MRSGLPMTTALLLAVLLPGDGLAADAKGKAKGQNTPPGVSRGILQQMETAGVAWRGGRATDTRGEVRADVILDPGMPVTRTDLAAAGVRVIAMSRGHARATVAVSDRESLRRLAEMSGVRMVAQDFGYRRRAGLVPSRAVEVMNVDAINGSDGSRADLDGSGITVGILSDSMSRTEDNSPGDPGVVDEDTTFDGKDTGSTEAKSSPVTMRGSRPQDDGELPAEVEILRDDASGELVDEGAAMAELIHDIAPGAGITFHTAVAGGIAGFADAIDTLCAPASGVDVVVDDIGFLAELMYQRDPISRAAEACVARGVPFFSAAGNSGQRAFRETYDDLLASDDDDGRETLFPPSERDFHDWAGGNPYLEVEVPADSTATAVLQWNQPALSVPANTGNGPRIDLDLLAFSDRSPFSVNTTLSSVIDQKAETARDGQDPVEVVRLDGGSGGRTFYLAVDHWAGAQDEIPQGSGTRLEFRLVFYESGRRSSTIQYLDTMGGPDPAATMYGHTVATGVFGVGAVPWYDAGRYLAAPNTGPSASRIDPQSYTALGGALERHFRPDGTFRRATQGPQPVIAATDGNNTSFFGTPWDNTGLEDEGGEDDTHPNFFGTSAAAPNAAAVAALLLEDDGTLTPPGIAGRLQAAAVDVTGRNAAVGCDAVTGSGLVDAGAALLSGDAPPRADAGRDRSVDAGDTVTLDGGDSTDNNFVDSYRWRQVAGPRVDLTSPAGARTRFDAPARPSTVVFELRVGDAACLSDSDRVTVEVQSDGGGGSVGGPLLLLALLLVTRARMPPRCGVE
ncbi:PKD domain-containing protein [Halofilum ochraceum]|uniref:PKD domain-containing protein n=1 Tax=Halofilum ochraceum TaxID=1611323 RepID=UPI00111309D1|nr:hypothetical protein [Halofilum ochraceum]